jgi:hypothetical protein
LAGRGCRGAPCHSAEELRRRAGECRRDPSSCISLEEAARILARRAGGTPPADSRPTIYD